MKIEIIFDSDRERARYIAEMCYGTAQGIKLAASDDAYQVGQHTEAMRGSWVAHVNMHPDDLIDDLEAALRRAGFEVDFRAPRGEGGKP